MNKVLHPDILPVKDLSILPPKLRHALDPTEFPDADILTGDTESVIALAEKLGVARQVREIRGLIKASHRSDLLELFDSLFGQPRNGTKQLTDAEIHLAVEAYKTAKTVWNSRAFRQALANRRRNTPFDPAYKQAAVADAISDSVARAAALKTRSNYTYKVVTSHTDMETGRPIEGSMNVTRFDNEADAVCYFMDIRDAFLKDYPDAKQHGSKWARRYTYIHDNTVCSYTINFVKQRNTPTDDTDTLSL